MTADEDAGSRPAARATMTEAEFRSLYAHLREQLPWGAEDRRGALNNLRPEDLLAALGEVSQGRTFSMSVPIESKVAADNPHPAVHQMTGTAATAADEGVSFGMDRIAMNVHGNADSHMDALCHVMFDHSLYNGVPADAVSDAGAEALSIAVARNGIAGRGVLLDIPAVRGTDWLEPGDHVTAGDLLAAEQRQHVRFGRGDLLFVRVGHRLRRTEQGPWDAASARAGLHPTVVPLLAERQISVLGCDSNSDTAASAVQGVDFPVHVLAVNAIGLPLLDYLQFEELLPACQQLGRYSFLCVIAPLRLARGTGSPVNPIAIV
ncbi:MAG TPA: cyclase family protein [Streptosporangiaceae bacterium]